MSYEPGVILAVKRSDGSINFAKFLRPSFRYAGQNAIFEATTDPVGTKKRVNGHVHTATRFHELELLNGDLTSTDKTHSVIMPTYRVIASLHKMNDTVVVKLDDGSTSFAKIIMPFIMPGNKIGYTVELLDHEHNSYQPPTQMRMPASRMQLAAPLSYGNARTKSADLPHELESKIFSPKEKLLDNPFEFDAMVINKMTSGGPPKTIRQNVALLKHFMHKYKTNPELLKKIKEKLNSIILGNRDIFHEFHGGAHPEWVMNRFIYNPSKNESFELLRIDGNQVTVKMHNPSARSSDAAPISMGLDAFLRKKIYDRSVHHMQTSAMIGEVYRIFPEQNGDAPEQDYDDDITEYLAHLMTTFQHKPSGEPSSEFFSVPIAAVPVPASSAASSFPPAASSSSSPSAWWQYRSTALKRKAVMNQILNPPKKLRKVSSASHAGSRKNPKSTHKRRFYKQSKKSKKH